MKLFKICTPACFGVLAVVCAPQPALANCEIIAKYGVYDLRTETSDLQRGSSYRLWFCQSNFSSKQEADQVGLSIGYGDFSLGFDSDSQSWSEFKSNYCHDESYNENYREATTTFVKSINPVVVAALNSCLTQKGLHAYIQSGSDSSMFFFRTIFNPPTSGVAEPVVEAFNVNNASCMGALAVGSKVDPSGTTMQCIRSGKDPVSILFDATWDVINDTPMSLAAIVTYPDPPKQSIIKIAANSYTESLNIAPQGVPAANYGSDVILNGPPYNDRPNMAMYHFNATAGGNYILKSEYAALQSRPVRIYINDKKVRDQALSHVSPQPNGCWQVTCQTWHNEGPIKLKTGANTMKIERDAVFPHIRAFRFEPTQ